MAATTARAVLPGPTPPPRRSPRTRVQRGRSQRRGSPGDLREQGGQASLLVGGEEEGQPISVDAPHDRFDIERRPVGRVEVQPSDAARRRKNRFPASTTTGHDTLNLAYRRGRRGVPYPSSPRSAAWEWTGCVAGEPSVPDPGRARKWASSGMRWDALLSKPTASLHMTLTTQSERRLLAFGPTPIPAPAPALRPGLVLR